MTSTESFSCSEDVVVGRNALGQEAAAAAAREASATAGLATVVALERDGVPGIGRLVAKARVLVRRAIQAAWSVSQ